LVAQMHEQVVITIELFVQGQHRHYLPQTAAILHGPRSKATRPGIGPVPVR
jgi:hypothetical protein